MKTTIIVQSLKRNVDRIYGSIHIFFNEQCLIQGLNTIMLEYVCRSFQKKFIHRKMRTKRNGTILTYGYIGMYIRYK